MSYKNVHKNLTPEARKRGADASLQRRTEKRNARIAQVQALRAEGMRKSEIAKKLGVSAETIRRDCLAFEENPITVATSIIDAIFVIVREHVNGNISKTEARQQVQGLIALALREDTQ